MHYYWNCELYACVSSYPCNMCVVCHSTPQNIYVRHYNAYSQNSFSQHDTLTLLLGRNCFTRCCISQAVKQMQFYPVMINKSSLHNSTIMYSTHN